MTSGADRRSVLTGLGALAFSGCAESRSPVPIDAILDLADLEAGHGGRIGFAASGDPGQVGWRGGERFLYCSTFKLFLAAAVLQRARQGAEDLNRTVVITAADMLSHAPVTQAAVGQSLTIERLCQAAVEQSDNPAANILIRELGGLRALKTWYESIGDQVTRVDRLELDLNRPDGDKDTTTPNQAIANLARLLATEPHDLGRDHQRKLWGWMLGSPTGPNRIKAGAGDRMVGHKTGTGANQTNDIGMVIVSSVFMPDIEDGPVVVAAYYQAPVRASADQRDAVIAEATRRGLKALGYD